MFALLFAGIAGRAQSLSLQELQSLTAMTTDQVHNYLVISKGFKPMGNAIINGHSFEQFSSNRINPEIGEIVSLGQNSQVLSGNTVRKVIYHTLRVQDMSSLLMQAKQSTMTLVFQGSDVDQKIFCFDNSLFTAIMDVGHDKKYGTVQLDEK